MLVWDSGRFGGCAARIIIDARRIVSSDPRFEFPALICDQMFQFYARSFNHFILRSRLLWMRAFLCCALSAEKCCLVSEAVKDGAPCRMPVPDPFSCFVRSSMRSHDSASEREEREMCAYLVINCIVGFYKL
jgi:hypothetical protein